MDRVQKRDTRICVSWEAAFFLKGSRRVKQHEGPAE